MPLVPSRPPAGTGPRTRPITVIIRALPGPACERRIVGQAEIVDTGEVVPVADIDDLIAVLHRLGIETAED